MFIAYSIIQTWFLADISCRMTGVCLISMNNGGLLEFLYAELKVDPPYCFNIYCGQIFKGMYAK